MFAESCTFPRGPELTGRVKKLTFERPLKSIRRRIPRFYDPKREGGLEAGLPTFAPSRFFVVTRRGDVSHFPRILRIDILFEGGFFLLEVEEDNVDTLAF